MANKQFGAKLKELRKKNGLTQKDVYSILEISQSTFSGWETGKTEPDVITFLKLCKIYKIEDIMLEFTGNSHSCATGEHLPDNEKQLIRAYRAHPEMQPAIHKMLDISAAPDSSGADNTNIGSDIADTITKITAAQTATKQK